MCLFMYVCIPSIMSVFLYIVVYVCVSLGMYYMVIDVFRSLCVYFVFYI